MLKILGYPDRYSVAPGETIAFKLSQEEGEDFAARLVRVVHGDCNPEGPGLKFRHVPTAIDGRHPGRRAAPRCRLLHDRRCDAAAHGRRLHLLRHDVADPASGA